jgi:small-conductance mechanosensitive channel
LSFVTFSTEQQIHFSLKGVKLKGIFSITKLILIVIAITVVIFQFSSVSGVAAGAISVAAGTIIGFSSRNTISNAIAGILLLSSRPFKIGDRIRTSVNDELIGDVIEITILYTKLRTIRNELVLYQIRCYYSNRL